jgi:hypothetical protein
MLIKSALDTFARTQIDRYLSRGKTNRRRLVGASEIGLCERRVWYSKQFNSTGILDTKHSDYVESWGASRRGVTFEKHFWLPAMRQQFGDNLIYAGSKQKTMVYGNLRATPDGLLVQQPRDLLKWFGINDIGKSREVVLECKTIDPRIPLQQAKIEHEFQAHVQLGMFHRCTEHRPEYALISYVNASFFDDVIEFVIRYDETVFQQALKRAAKILKAVKSEQMRAEGWIAGGKECGYCPFKVPCDETRLPTQRDSKPDVIRHDQKTVDELTRLGTQEREIHTTISGLEDDQRNIQEEIKSCLRKLSLREFDSNGIRIVWSAVVGRPAYDMPKIREAAAALGLDIQQFERVGAPSDRLTITLRKLPDPGSQQSGSKLKLET